MPKFRAVINVYFSKRVEIEVNGDSEEHALLQILDGECNDEIDDQLADGADFELSTNYCDDYVTDHIEEVV
jgi:hypothetical protein